MAEQNGFIKKLYAEDPLFRALVHSRLETGPIDLKNHEFDFSAISIDDEIEILREYAITLYKEHKTLKGLFIGNLKVGSKSVDRKDSSPPAKGS